MILPCRTTTAPNGPPQLARILASESRMAARMNSGFIGEILTTDGHG
jgi:hypothetical protein